MSLPGTGNPAVISLEDRPLFRQAAVLVLAAAMVVLPAAMAEASSSITVQDLQTAGHQAAADRGTGTVLNGSADFVFEEPVAVPPDLQPAPVEPSSQDCAVGEGQETKPRIAIIIDDMGYHQRLGHQLLNLDLNLTFSFLPHGPFTQGLEELAWQGGHDILVHMPMEATDPSWDPGPGTLHLADPPETLRFNVARNLAAVPHAVGVNNHMGSRFTEDRSAMQHFLEMIEQQGFFFIDSSTSSDSVAMDTARAMGIRTARRHVFLDNIQTQEDICRQLKLLVREAVKRGWAVGIGHPNEATLTALTRCRTLLLEQVEIVGIRELVE